MQRGNITSRPKERTEREREREREERVRPRFGPTDVYIYASQTSMSMPRCLFSPLLLFLHLSISLSLPFSRRAPLPTLCFIHARSFRAQFTFTFVTPLSRLNAISVFRNDFRWIRLVKEARGTPASLIDVTLVGNFFLLFGYLSGDALPCLG